MMPGALHAAIGSTIVNYSQALSPDGPPAEAVIADAVSKAVLASTDEARKQMEVAADGKQVELCSSVIVPYVGPGFVVMTCTLLFEIIPVVFDVPQGHRR